MNLSTLGSDDWFAQPRFMHLCEGSEVAIGRKDELSQMLE